MKTKKDKKTWKPHNAIMSCMRRTFSRSPIVRNVLNKATHPTLRGPRGGRVFICSICGKPYGASGVEVDHIVPVIPLEKTIYEMDWSEVMERMFCDESKLRVLCKACHKSVTAEQRRQRTIHGRRRRGEFIVCLETRKIFSDDKEAAKAVGLKSGSGITKCCKNKKGKSAGYTWRFIKDTNLI